MEWMNCVFHEYLDQFIIMFSDDVLTYPKTEENQNEHLKDCIRNSKIGENLCQIQKVRILAKTSCNPWVIAQTIEEDQRKVKMVLS